MASSHKHARKMAIMITLLQLSHIGSHIYRLGPSFTYKRGYVVTKANAVIGESCAVLPHHPGTPHILAVRKKGFVPEADPKDESLCTMYQNARSHKTPLPAAVFNDVPVASCVNRTLGAVYPCAEGGLLRSDPGKYCRAPTPRDLLNASEAKAMNQCARLSVPILIPGFTEWWIHPTNINHVGRDIAFIAGMLGLGRRSGYTVMIGDLDDFAKHGMGEWGKHLLRALSQYGGLNLGNWVEEADSMLKRLNIRRAKSDFPSVKNVVNATASVDNEGVSKQRQDSEQARDVTLSELDVLSCGVVCATTAARYAVSGFVEADDAVILQQAALRYCNLPKDPPQQRSLFLITRHGLRSIHNLPEVNERLKSYATSLGLAYVAENIGGFDFCGQVRLASQAVIMVGDQGADPANLFFQHADSMFVELYGNNDPSTSMGTSAGITAYMQQVAAAGRRGNAVVLLNVSDCGDRNWMYNSKCKLELDVKGLIATLEKWGPPHLKLVDSPPPSPPSLPAAAPVQKRNKPAWMFG